MQNNTYLKHQICLELDRVLNIVAEEAGILDSTEKIRSITPAYDFSQTKILLKKTEDAYMLAAKFGTPRLSGVKNVDAALNRAKSGGNLSLKELLEVAEDLRNIRALYEYREQFSSVETSLDDYFNSLFPNKYFEEKIFTSIISEDTVSDNASHELADIRRNIRKENLQIREKLDKIIRSQAHQKHLQDAIITQRDGRYVIPVKQEYRTEVDGLIHDTSSSGATLFIEPAAVVEANNKIRILEAKERDEILRIISELSGEAATFSDSILVSYKAMFEIDICFAKANYAYKTKAIMPILNDKGVIELSKARHPLIAADTVVPIDIRLGKDFSTLVITGPNTGGKTVALKTLGLLTLMTMCGLMIPASDGSKISVFDGVFADIGDEQSIDQSLSSFSSHMVNIVDILNSVSKNSLVLLDEIGAGTDPIEGAALAVSILEMFKKVGAKTAATTHYAEMKIYALENDGVENASCEFDISTLKPTYKLMIGIPGKSNAFAISKKLGISDEIIENAKNLISSEDTRFEDVMEKLEEKGKQLEKEKAELQRLIQDNKKAKEDINKLSEQIVLKSEEQIEEARNEAKKLVFEVTERANQLFSELEELRKQKNKKEFVKNFSDTKAKLRSDINKLEEKADPIKKRGKSFYKLPRPLIMGDSVKLIDIDKEGIIISPPDNNGNAFVRVGIMKMRVPVSNLMLIENKPERTKSAKSGVESRATREVKTEIDIRGMDSIEGVIEVERFIDSAILSGLNTITIIHGKGTGVLRKAVWDRLKTHRNVKSYRSGVFGEGEMGVTVVEIK